METPEGLKKEKSIVDLIPHAVDPTHPWHEEFWIAVATGGVILEENELDELLAVAMANLNKIRSSLAQDQTLSQVELGVK